MRSPCHVPCVEAVLSGIETGWLQRAWRCRMHAVLLSIIHSKVCVNAAARMALQNARCHCLFVTSRCVCVCVLMLQAYHGGLQHVRDPAARASRVHKVVDKAAAAVEAISKQAGLQCQVVTGGGSGTYRIEAASGVYTEVQPGGCWL